MSLGQPLPASNSSGEIVTFVSGKGGVGKTNLAVNVAIEIARRGERVILLDADFGLANADILLNMHPRRTFADLFEAGVELDDVLVDGPCGLRILFGISGAVRGGGRLSVDSRAVTAVARQLAARCDVLLIDCGAGCSTVIDALAHLGDRLLLVTTPEPTAVTDAYATLKMLERRHRPHRPSVVVNMAQSHREADRVYRRLARVVDQFLRLPLEYLGYVPMDRAVPAAVMARRAVVLAEPRCAAAVEISRLAERLRPDFSLVAPDARWAQAAGLLL